MSQDNPEVPAEYRCSYCGGSLDLRYPFCVHCARPYRAPEEDLLEPLPPVKPGLDTVLATEGRSALNLFFVLAICLVATGTVGGALPEHLTAHWILFQDLLVAGLTLGFAAAHWREIAPLFRHIWIHWELGTCLPALALLLLLNKGYHEFLMSVLGIDPEDTPFVRLRESLGPQLTVIALCIFPAIFEEIGFRGLVQTRLVRATGRWIGFTATSVLFVALHFNILSAPYLFLLSMYLCWLRAATASIYPCMVLHFLHNFTVLFLFHGDGP
jgi:membrane protease YdiL (CAAX protease family)